MSDHTFKQYHLCNEILETLSLLKYNNPTKVQELVIPAALKNQDILVKSRTGSGKTASFGIPICEMIDWEKKRPQALILVPTRELALQVSEELSNIGRFKKIKVCTVFGRMPMKAQIQALKQKTHIVVGTPGRTLDLITRGDFITDELTHVVIDEADEMFFIGLREQVESILKVMPEKRNTMLFSATLEEDVKKLANQYMKDPVEIELAEEEKEKSRTSQSAILTSEREKMELLKKVTITENPDSCIIFANTQKEVDAVADYLSRNEYPCGRLHGGMEQRDRIRIIQDFKRNKFRYLIATDVAARGIDIDNISLVINYDISRGIENYVHRIGRTGRYESTGKAITFYLDKEKEKLEAIESYTGVSIERLDLIPEPTELQKTEFMTKLKRRVQFKQEKGAKINEGITKLQINAGKKAKIRPCEIVATICGIDGITKDDIGIIQIVDTASFVEILNGKGNQVLKGIQTKTIKGKSRKVFRARREQH
ncbi:MAG: DEAD/DEAH box helicase [Lachnospiraceae bacterium]|nr:DEAD/DEAH box helicase [Lachnospiraceae bacterium]